MAPDWLGNDLLRKIRVMIYQKFPGCIINLCSESVIRIFKLQH